MPQVNNGDRSQLQTVPMGKKSRPQTVPIKKKSRPQTVPLKENSLSQTVPIKKKSRPQTTQGAERRIFSALRHVAEAKEMESSESVDQQKKKCRTKKVIVVKIPGACDEPTEEQDCGRETRNRRASSFSQDGARYTQTPLASEDDGVGEIKGTAKLVWRKGHLRGGVGIARGWLSVSDMLLVLKPFGLQILTLQPPPDPRRNVSVKYLRRARRMKPRAAEQDQKSKYRGRQSPPRKAPTVCHLDPSHNDQLRHWLDGKDLLAKKERRTKRRERRAAGREQRRREQQKEERAKVSERKVKEWLEKKCREAPSTQKHQSKPRSESELRQQRSHAGLQSRGTLDTSAGGQCKGEGFFQGPVMKRTSKSSGVLPGMQNRYPAVKLQSSVRRHPISPSNGTEKRPSAPVQAGKPSQLGVPAETTDRPELQVDVKPVMTLSRTEQNVASLVVLAPSHGVREHKANKAGLLSSKEPRLAKEKARLRQDGDVTGFQGTECNLRPLGKRVNVMRAIRSPQDADGKLRGHSARGTHSEWLQEKVEEGMERKEAKLDPQLKHPLAGLSWRRGLITMHEMKKVTATEVTGKNGALSASRSVQLGPDRATEHCTPGASVQTSLGDKAQGIQEDRRLYERPEPQGSEAQELSDSPV